MDGGYNVGSVLGSLLHLTLSNQVGNDLAQKLGVSITAIKEIRSAEIFQEQQVASVEVDGTMEKVRTGFVDKDNWGFQT